jgi:hypothetical protein
MTSRKKANRFEARVVAMMHSATTGAVPDGRPHDRDIIDIQAQAGASDEDQGRDEIVGPP